MTVLLLGLLSLPARRILEASTPSPVIAPAPAQAPKRLFGAYVDPWHLGEWSSHVGVAPQLVAKFESFSQDRTIDAFLQEVQNQGVTRAMVSWEPWKPVPAQLGPQRQAQPQPGYRNIDVATGSQDAYIRRFARSLAGFHGVVYLRYAHEMNGFWYPWSSDPPAYVAAWRRIVRIIRREGARNVRFVWSVNPNLYESRGAWLRKLRRYWPGRGYVDVAGSTMINFGGAKDYTVSRFEPRLRELRRVFREPVFLTETNTDRADRVSWLRGLRRMLERAPWIRALAWSQLPSRGKAQNAANVGDMSWSVTSDPRSAALLRAIARDGSR
jgi:mannan endo-1,4-beta-mannosidase